MRLWIKFKRCRWIAWRFVYVAFLGLLIMMTLTRVGQNSRRGPSWISITGEVDIDQYTIMSSANAMIVRSGYGMGALERNDYRGDARQKLSRIPRLGKRNDTLQGKINYLNTVRGGKYLKEPTDPHEYRYINTPRNVCFDRTGKRVSVPLIIFVTSALGNLKRRDHIRVTYGNDQAWELFNKTLARTVFMLGSTSDPVLQAKIDDEAKIYGDILQEDFIDSYLNLTRKTVMGMKWVANHCRHARFALKIDDDSMINKARILEFILRAPTRGVVVGNVNLNTPVIRAKNGMWGKYYISEEFYPASRYPPYFSGPALLMSTDLVRAIYQMAVTTPLFPWEDVFVGMCLQKIGVRLMHDDHFLCSLAIKGCYSDREWVKHAVFIDLSLEHMIRVWVESSLYADKLLSAHRAWK